MSAFAAAFVAWSDELVTDRPALSCFTECHCIVDTVKDYILHTEYYIRFIECYV